jgi:hypothetical protein
MVVEMEDHKEIQVLLGMRIKAVEVVVVIH